jgi:two-component system, NarL family, sensor histidine kinase UhpB
MDKKLFVLIIEDSQADAELNVKLLRTAGYNISYKRVETAQEMTEALELETWDLILSDYSNPRFSIQAALKIYRAHAADIPFIVISGVIGEKKAMQLIKAGVHDYLLKGNMARFIPIVERELRAAFNRRELVKVCTALALSEEKFRIYVENAPDAVFVTDRIGKFTYVNDATSQIAGYTRDELLKMSIQAIITEESLNKVTEEFYKLLEPDSFKTDLEVYHKDGSKRWMAVDVIRLFKTQFLVFSKDITDWKNVVLELTKAKEELEQLDQYLTDARENERATIAMEIHDELGQALTAIKIDLNWVLEHIADSAKSFQKISGIIALTNDTIKIIQRISAELRPGLLDDLGLVAAIEWYSDEFEKRTGIKCELMLEDLTEGDKRISLALFRILQEALTNVIRHANAKTVRITLRYTPRGITMIIEDDGVGISQEKITNGKSLGLSGMRERARQINGSVEFSKNTVAGTKIVTFIPVPTHEPA